MSLKKISTIFFIISFLLLAFLTYLEILPRYTQRRMMSNWESNLYTTKANVSKQSFLKVEKKGRDKNQLGVLSVPKINLRQVIIYDATPQNLALAPALIKNTAYPGTIGNAAIAGHRVSHGFPFRNIHLLSRGDKIIFSNSSGSFTYKVEKKFRVVPSNLSVLAWTNFPQITLLACDPPFSARYRLAVIARGVGVSK